MTARTVTLVHLYPRDMNIYGDHGNVLTLVRRLRWHGYGAAVVEVGPGDPLPDDVDLIVGGGGQDSGQQRIVDDLAARAASLRALADDGTPMLMVCGLYQLFGHVFRTADGSELRGIGVLDLETSAGRGRLVGNVVSDTTDFGEMVGFENHSGRTTLGGGAVPLGRVALGTGNNGEDRTEGARYREVVGTYLHGAVLPRNPRLADHLIGTAVRRRLGSFEPRDVDDTIADQIHRLATSRPRRRAPRHVLQP